MHRDRRILNPRLAAAMVGLGHGQTIVIVDAGLPVPPGVDLLDLSLVEGVPGFIQTLSAVARELVVERVLVAVELGPHSQAMRQQVAELFGSDCVHEVTHDEIKSMTAAAALVVRTGECSPYANAVLTGGVAF